MSRIIVKQLPKNITEEKLRNHFGTKGHITDIQLKYTTDGKFRQFCFIGYENDAAAQAAIQFFNNSFIQTSRIKVELSAALGAEAKPLPWSKHSKDNIKAVKAREKQAKAENKIEKKPKVDKIDEIIGSHKDDPEFLEFMKVHDQNRTLWANDLYNTGENDNEESEKEEHHENEVDNVNDDDDNDNDEASDKEASEAEDAEEAEESEDGEKLAEKQISDLEYMKSLMTKSTKIKEKTIAKTITQQTKKKLDSKIDLFTIKIHNVPYNIKRQDIIKFFKPIKPYSVRLPSKVHGFCYVGFKTEKDMSKAMLKHKSFIKGTQVFFSDFTEKNKISKAKTISNNDAENNVANNTKSKWSKQAESLKNEESIAESGKIFFRNLSHTVVDDDLQKLFEKFGPIAELNLPVDPITRRIKCFGTVTFVMPEHAVVAFNQLDGSDFHGRLLHLIPGKSQTNDTNIDENDPTLTFKQKKALKLKKTAQQTGNWNSLFLGQNAVADMMAKQYNTTKEKILDTNQGGSSAAVRMALGETQIVIEMKKFMEMHGVNLSAFDTPTSKRSKTILLSKNLPADTTPEELIPIFTKFGPLVRLLLPPGGVTALIEYCDATEARQAFKKLAYSKFKHLPLYLEWAPENTFNTAENKNPIIPKNEAEKEEEMKKSNETDTNANVTAKENEQKDDNADDDSDYEEPEPNTTLFLRNLNFKTTKETVHEHFKSCGKIHTIEIAKRKDPDNPRNLISLGYGFIQFKKSAVAEKVLKNMQFTMIEDNNVELKRSDRTLKTAENVQRKPRTVGKQTGSKILVRNIPFQAKADEVRDIFKAFGEISSVRLPLKMTSGEKTHRGFGFVDYVSKNEAKAAFEALCQSTHLYGRRLVLEWAAKDGDNIEDLRKRTAVEFYGSSKAPKNSRKSVFNADGSLLHAGSDILADDDE